MPRFMDFHAELKLPPEAIAQIADDTRHERADHFRTRRPLPDDFRPADRASLHSRLTP